MKMKDIISEQDAISVQEEYCLLCAVHEKASDKITDALLCPYCNKPNVYIPTRDDYIIVGESNSYEPDDEIEKYLSSQCGECGEIFILRPEKVIYNANHDVFYTGGSEYLNDSDLDKILDDIQKKFETIISHYLKRIKKGEKLAPFYPALWCKGEIEHVIAEYLFKKGLKK